MTPEQRSESARKASLVRWERWRQAKACERLKQLKAAFAEARKQA